MVGYSGVMALQAKMLTLTKNSYKIIYNKKFNYRYFYKILGSQVREGVPHQI